MVPRPAVAPTAAPEAAPSPSPPLTALQRLQLARKQAASASNSAAASRAPSAVQSSSPSPTGTPPPLADSPAKPVSKLALLAQKRREAAAAAGTGSGVPSPGLPASPSPVATAEPVSAPPSPAAGPTSATEIVAPSPVKPLSKLAQKMAAARAAREAGVATKAESSAAGATAAPQDAPETVVIEPVDDMWSFLPSSSTTVPHKASTSTFFDILTSHSPELGPPEPPSLENMHIAVRGDPAAAVGRVREAFGPGTESPDDIVLRMRDGRAGTGEVAPSEQKAVKVEKRSAKAPAPAAPVASEFDKAAVSTKQKKDKGEPKVASGKPKKASASNGGSSNKPHRPDPSRPTSEPASKPTKGSGGAVPPKSKPGAVKGRAQGGQ